MNRFSYGIIVGSLSGASWGLNTVIISFIMMASIFLPYSENIFITALVGAFLHDLFSAIWLILNLIREKKISQLLRPFKSKIGIFLIIGAILGGPVGMAGYLLGTKYIGAAYASSFSALYPALGTVLSAIILKEKINMRMKIGVVVSGIGILLLSYSPIDLSIYPHYTLGIFFSLFCVLGWALECVIASYSMKYGEVDSSVAICIRQIISAIFYGVIVIPFVSGYPLVSDIFNTNIIFLFIGTALVGSLSYLFWYKAINLIGAPRGMSLNITYIVWTMIFSKLILNTDLTFQFIIASIIIFIGIVMIAGDIKEMLKSK